MQLFHLGMVHSVIDAVDASRFLDMIREGGIVSKT
jgi:hypothetical protein